ncbi:flagellar hook-length control protein FliK [Paracidovorax citrulli]
MDISQILGSGAARPDSARAPQAQSQPGGDFGNALVRARETGVTQQQGSGKAAQGEPSQARRNDAAQGKPSATPADKTAAKGKPRDGAERAGAKDEAAGQANAQPAEPAANAANAATAVADTGADTPAGDEETTTAEAGSADAALLAAMFGLPLTPAPATGPAPVAAAAPAAAAAASAIAPGAAATLPAGAQVPADPASLAADTLQTIATQRAALAPAADPAAADGEAATANLHAMLPQTDAADDSAVRTGDSSKPATSIDSLLKNAVAAQSAATGQNAGGQTDGQAARQDSAELRAATAPATAPVAAAPSANAALQAAIAASQPAEAPAASADARTDAISVLTSNVATGSAAQDAQAAVRHGVLSPRVGDSDWSQALSQQVVRLTTQGNHTAELQLNPPDLGPLKIVLNVADDRAQAQFVSSHASVRAAIEAALPQLRNALADTGIQLGQTSVGAEQHFAGQAGQQQQQNGQRGSGPAWNALAGSETVTDAPAVTVTASRQPQGEVDTFV